MTSVISRTNRLFCSLTSTSGQDAAERAGKLRTLQAAVSFTGGLCSIGAPALPAKSADQLGSGEGQGRRAKHDVVLVLDVEIAELLATNPIRIGRPPNSADHCALDCIES